MHAMKIAGQGCLNTREPVKSEKYVLIYGVTQFFEQLIYIYA
jgi:hypothetical protein